MLAESVAFQVGLGLGIHGEPGAEKGLISDMNRDEFTNDVLSNVCQRLDAAIGSRNELVSSTASLAVMVNNLGAVSQAEMLIVCNAVASYLYSRTGTILNGYRYPVQMFMGHYITSLQMYGISVTILVLPDNDNGSMNKLLQAPTACTAWIKGFSIRPPEDRTVIPISRYHFREESTNVEVEGSGLNPTIETIIKAVTKALLSHCDELSAIDQKTGDGDFGDTGRPIKSNALLLDLQVSSKW